MKFYKISEFCTSHIFISWRNMRNIWDENSYTSLHFLGEIFVKMIRLSWLMIWFGWYEYLLFWFSWKFYSAETFLLKREKIIFHLIKFLDSLSNWLNWKIWVKKRIQKFDLIWNSLFWHSLNQQWHLRIVI